MRRLAFKNNSAAACCLAVCCVVAAPGCVSSFGWPSRTGPAANLRDEFDTQLSLARLSERHGQNDQARKIYEAVLKKSPDNQMAHHRLGVMAARESRPAEAEAHFRRAAEAAPPTVELLNDMGYCLYLQDRMNDAEQTFRQALEIDPQSKLAHNNLGLVLGEMGRNEESLKEFRHAVGEAEAHSNLAYARSQAGDVRAAEQHYHRALALDQTLRPSAEALVDLARMRASLENAHSARARVADHAREQDAVALASAQEPAPRRSLSAPRQIARRQLPQQDKLQASPLSQATGADARLANAAMSHASAAQITDSPETEVEGQSPAVIDWRNPIASVRPPANARQPAAHRPESPSSAGDTSSAQHHYDHLPAAFRPTNIAVTGALAPPQSHLEPRGSQDSHAMSQATMVRPAAEKSPTAQTPPTDDGRRPSLLSRALRNVRTTMGTQQAQASNSSPAQNSPAADAVRRPMSNDTVPIRPRSNTAARVSFHSDSVDSGSAASRVLASPASKPDAGKVSISLGDSSSAMSDQPSAFSATRRSSTASVYDSAGGASPTMRSTVSFQRPKASQATVDRIPSLSQEISNRRVSWEKDSGIRPPEVTAHMPQSFNTEGAARRPSASNPASGIHAKPTPWSQPTWTPESAAKRDSEASESIAPGIVSPPAKTIENPYTMLPQR
ncbi:MAG: tetratricopeptide repeat protein [Pirellulaceae bacterium]